MRNKVIFFILGFVIVAIILLSLFNKTVKRAAYPTPTPIDKNIADELRLTCYYNTGSYTSEAYKKCYKYYLTH